MNKIKIVGIIIPFIVVILALLSHFSSDSYFQNRDTIDTLNTQKEFTQNISKNIFFIYKNRDNHINNLDKITKNFLNENSNKIKHNQKTIKLWNRFYKDVQQFKDHINENNMYSNILKKLLVKKIYNTNQMLLVEFDKEITKIEKTFINKVTIYKYIEYLLYGLLTLLLVYLASKIHYVVEFIQKFLITSKKIRQNSTIKGLKPIKINQNDENIKQATKNFNTLVDKINLSIQNSASSLEYSHKALEEVEKDIENFMELIYSVENHGENKDISQKEDAVIDSLEEVLNASKKLKDLKKDLKELVNGINLT